MSAADIDNNGTSTSSLEDVGGTTQTKSDTSIESNSIENQVSNEYETITNVNSSSNENDSTDLGIVNSSETIGNTSDNTTKQKQSVIISSSPITTYANQTITINANVTKDDGELLNSAKAAIKINGNTIGQTRVNNGSVSFEYALPKWQAKTYNITIVVGETSKTMTASSDFDLTIIRHDIVINMSDITVYSAANATLYATVNYENGSVVDGAKAVFKINGKTIASTTVKEGVVSVDYIVPTKANTYPLVLKIGESTVSNYNETEVNLIVEKRTPTVITDSLFFVKKGYTVTLKATFNNTGYAYATGKVGFKVNGKTVATVQLVNGTAQYVYDSSSLRTGIHNISIVYGGSNALNEVRYNTALRVQNDLVSTYTYSQILTKANLTYEFILNNGKLPNFARMNGNEVSMSDFLYLLTQTLTYNNSLHNGGFATPSTNTKTSEYGAKIYKEDYLSLAKIIVDSYISTGKAPGVIKSSSGVTMSFEDAVYCYTRILNFLEVNDVLPAYSSVLRVGSSSGSTSGGSSGSGTTTYDSGNSVPSGYEIYLAYAENADINNTVIVNAVKSAVSGVTGTYNQAVAIFNYVSKKTDYSSYFNTKYGAVGTLTGGYGNCVDQAHLLLGMYRTAKIPARYCHATCTFRSGLVVGHVWVEAYVNGKWYSCDTTSNYNTFGNIVNWYSSTTVNRYISISF